MATRSEEAWQLVRSMLDDLTGVVLEDAESELEVVEGLRVLGRTAALCSELSLDADPEQPLLVPMTSPLRYVGGPNPDGDYHVATIDGAHRYRVEGRRGTACYLGLQVLAGQGLEPRHQAAYVSDRDLPLGPDGRFSLVLAEHEPALDELAGATWVPVPGDASALVVRQYYADRPHEEPAQLTVTNLDDPGNPGLPSDEGVAAQLTAMAWTIAKLATLHRTILPELRDDPNLLVTAEVAALGSENTTPDNLYMLGVFRLDPGEALIVDAEPPDSRYWSLTLENIWHECFDVRRRPTSLTSGQAVLRPDGTVRIVIAASDPGADNWLDTGGRHRGFMVFRWLDRPAVPAVRTEVVPLSAVTR
jgi:hypothetical protein